MVGRKVIVMVLFIFLFISSPPPPPPPRRQDLMRARYFSGWKVCGKFNVPPLRLPPPLPSRELCEQSEGIFLFSFPKGRRGASSDTSGRVPGEWTSKTPGCLSVQTPEGGSTASSSVSVSSCYLCRTTTEERDKTRYLWRCVQVQNVTMGSFLSCITRVGFDRERRNGCSLGEHWMISRFGTLSINLTLLTLFLYLWLGGVSERRRRSKRMR